jgi:hypothetical protein
MAPGKLYLGAGRGLAIEPPFRPGARAAWRGDGVDD